MGIATRPSLISIGHTPDLDDAFMFYAWTAGKVAQDVGIRHVIEDIQTLNTHARRAELDVTAVSVAAYPLIAKDYWILAVGSSIGQDYGPLVVSTTPYGPDELRGKTIAIPGLQTTAALVLRLAIPDCVPVEMRFEDIPRAVLSGQLEAGLLIHEKQLTYRDDGLLPVLDLGTWWQKQTALPLPLGINVVKHSLGHATAVKIAAALRDSILYAVTHQEETLNASMRFGRGIDVGRARQFVGMYVNEETLLLSPESRQAMHVLYQRAAAAGLLDAIPPLVFIEPPASPARR